MVYELAVQLQQLLPSGRILLLRESDRTDPLLHDIDVGLESSELLTKLEQGLRQLCVGDSRNFVELVRHLNFSLGADFCSSCFAKGSGSALFPALHG